MPMGHGVFVGGVEGRRRAAQRGGQGSVSIAQGFPDPRGLVNYSTPSLSADGAGPKNHICIFRLNGNTREMLQALTYINILVRNIKTKNIYVTKIRTGLLSDLVVTTL